MSENTQGHSWQVVSECKVIHDHYNDLYLKEDAIIWILDDAAALGGLYSVRQLFCLVDYPGISAYDFLKFLRFSFN